MPLPNDPKIAIIVLGYVGLPLAMEFGKKWGHAVKPLLNCIESGGRSAG